MMHGGHKMDKSRQVGQAACGDSFGRARGRALVRPSGFPVILRKTSRPLIWDNLDPNRTIDYYPSPAGRGHGAMAGALLRRALLLGGEWRADTPKLSLSVRAGVR